MTPAVSQLIATALLQLTESCPARNVVLVAHRGSSVAAPENTLAAFALGFENGVGAIECDLRTSADGEIVMVHDDTLDRTTDGTGAVEDFTLAELMTLDAGSRYSPEFAGERIPTLAETLTLAEGKGKVFLDIKAASPAAVAEAVAASNLAESDILILTWSDSQESQFAAALPGASVLRSPEFQPLIWDDGYILADKNRGGDGYGFWHSSITRPFVEDAHRLGMLVYAFTVNSVSEAQRLVDIGVDGIITDVPTTIREGVDFDPTLRVRTFAANEEGRVTLTWRSIVGNSYRVETCTDLAAEWDLVEGSEIIAADILSTFETAAAPDGPHRFFRVFQTNQHRL